MQQTNHNQSNHQKQDLGKLPLNPDDNFGLGKLHPKEAGLIYMIRNLYRFGSVEITTADGLPKQVRKREYTNMIPEGVPLVNPMDNINETMEMLHRLTNLM